MIIRDTGYGHKLEDTGFLPGVMEALKALTDAEYMLIVVTNQSGVARGYFSQEDVEKLHSDIAAEAQKNGSRIEKFYYCKHRSDDGCNCRKPSPYFVFEAQKEFDIDLERSYFVGDRDTDVECGENAGVKESILVSEEKNLLWAVRKYIVPSTEY